MSNKEINSIKLVVRSDLLSLKGLSAFVSAALCLINLAQPGLLRHTTPFV